MKHGTAALIATVATTAATLVVGVGVAFASIPAPGGVIYGCYEKSGDVRVIDLLLSAYPPTLGSLEPRYCPRAGRRGGRSARAPPDSAAPRPRPASNPRSARAASRAISLCTTATTSVGSVIGFPNAWHYSSESGTPWHAARHSLYRTLKLPVGCGR
jgi:hypothetical protein